VVFSEAKKNQNNRLINVKKAIFVSDLSQTKR